MKRRKRTSKNIPAKGRLRDMADQLWSLAVKDDWHHKCAVCGKAASESHHLLPRQHEQTRYDLMNGIALCSRHHQFCPDVSPHQNAAGWLLWLEQNYPERRQWIVVQARIGQYKRFQGTKTPAYYIEHIRRLREYVPPEEFERICGVRFSAWLEKEDKE